jgi:hypothetical protein
MKPVPFGKECTMIRTVGELIEALSEFAPSIPLTIMAVSGDGEARHISRRTSIGGIPLKIEVEDVRYSGDKLTPDLDAVICITNASAEDMAIA